MKALILVDIQYGFLPGGALAVPKGDEVVDVARALMPRFDLVVATQDWHPADHGSFASQHPGKNMGEMIDLEGLPQVLWPDHCVQDTRGAELVDELDKGLITAVFQKGTDRKIDSYSGFFDNGHRKATGLGDFLKERGVTGVTLIGLATDYCVKFTALDALSLGFATTVVLDGVRGVELSPGDCDKALAEMKAKGARLVSLSELG